MSYHHHRDRDDPPTSGGAIDGVLLNTLGKALLPLNIALTSETLGRGTFSIVYRAIISGDGAAAVKCIHGLYPGNVYRREAMLAAEAASSGGGLPLLTVAALPTAPIMVTPHVHARSFAALVRSASLEEARRYMRSLLLDLSVVHACGIVHRDVKPKNFVYDCKAGVGWLTDFGLADTVEALSRKLQKKLAAARTQQEKALAAREAGGVGGAGKASGGAGGASRARTNTGGTGMHYHHQQQQQQQQQQRRVAGFSNTAAVQSRGGSERGGGGGGGGGARRPFGGAGDTGMVVERGAFDESTATNAPKGKAVEVTPPSPLLNPNPSAAAVPPPSVALPVAVAGGAAGGAAAPPPPSHPPSSRDRERQEAEEYLKVSSDARKESRAGNVLRLLPGGVEGGAREILKGRKGCLPSGASSLGMDCEGESDGEEKEEMAQLQARLQRLNVALRDCFVGLPVTTLENASSSGGASSDVGGVGGVDREGRGEGGDEEMGASGSGEARVEDRTSSARVGEEGDGVVLESLSDHLMGGGDGSAISSSSIPAAAASMLGVGSGGGGGGGGGEKGMTQGGSGEAPPKDSVTVKSSHSGGSGSTKGGGRTGGGGGGGGGGGLGGGGRGGRGSGGGGGGGGDKWGSVLPPPPPPLPLDASVLDTAYPPHPWGLLPPSMRGPPPPKHRSDPVLEGGLAEQHADRAGTPGFRAPEVLLSSLQQGPALDVWGAGVILLSLLCRRYPLLPGRSDEEQLITLTQLMRDSLRYSSALSLGKELVEIPFSGVGVSHTNTTAGGLASLIGASRLTEPGFDAAFNLILACLDPDPLRRITAAGALQHPFFTGADMGGRGGAYVPTPSTVPWPVMPSGAAPPPPPSALGAEGRSGAAIKARLQSTMRAFKERVAGLGGRGDLGGSIGAATGAAEGGEGWGGGAAAAAAATMAAADTTIGLMAGTSGGVGGEEEVGGGGGGGNNMGSEPEEDSDLESEGGDKGRMGNSNNASQMPSGDDGDDGDGSG